MLLEESHHVVLIHNIIVILKFAEHFDPFVDNFLEFWSQTCSIIIQKVHLRNFVNDSFVNFDSFVLTEIQVP